MDLNRILHACGMPAYGKHAKKATKKRKFHEYNMPLDVITHYMVRFVPYFEIPAICRTIGIPFKDIKYIMSKAYKLRLKKTVEHDYIDGEITTYTVDGIIHREGDLPAVECENGTVMWYQNGQLHRDNDLPAKIFYCKTLGHPNCRHSWRENGLCRRPVTAVNLVRERLIDWRVNGQFWRSGNRPLAIDNLNNEYDYKGITLTARRPFVGIDCITGEKIVSSCIDWVANLCAKHQIAPDHGLEHAISVAEWARIGLTDFPALEFNNVLLVLLAALMHDIDDAKIFATTDYANAVAFLQTTPFCEADRNLVIKMISLVSYSQNKNEVPNDMPKWAFIPRDADRIAGGGQCGIDRTIEYNAGLRAPRPLVTEKDIALFDTFPVTRDDVQSKFNSETTRQNSLFEFYITNWHNRGVCASGSRRLQELFERDYGILLDYWVAQINACRL
jgi:uncharacterized protein